MITDSQLHNRIYAKLRNRLSALNPFTTGYLSLIDILLGIIGHDSPAARGRAALRRAHGPAAVVSVRQPPLFLSFTGGNCLGDSS